jgi:predicted DNA-binding transcriptional regulator AlpA
LDSENRRQKMKLTPDMIMAEAKTSPLISMAEAERLTGGMLKIKTLHNWASKGRGPHKIKISPNRSGYLLHEFAEWLAETVKEA